ncbi:MAG: sterol desaturase family protein [Burkholderiales bacterium]|nr:MAG: sterol desaturase family protein [Burkholderiales bacterium]
MHDVLLYALPVFGLGLLAEWAWGWWRRRQTYALADTVSSLSQGLMSQAVAAITPLFQTGLYASVHGRLAMLPGTLWHGAAGLLACVVMYDFCDYWLHRASHECAFFWAAHAVHHQSEHFNLSTALRQESLYTVVGAPFFLPMALLGVPTEQYALAGIVVLFYQYWIHTEHIGRLGWLDRVFSTPSNHRVHHAVNPPYLDRNYGAILVLWDRLFGSFAEEREPCVYGTVKPLHSWNPLTAVGQVYAELWTRMRATPRLADKLRVLWKSPGWVPPGADFQALPSAERLGQRRFDPPAPRWARAAAVTLLALTGAAGGLWLSAADDAGLLANLGAATALSSALWAIGWLLSRRGPAQAVDRAPG